MKTLSTILVLLASCLFASAPAAEPTIRPAKPQEGVFFTYTGYMTTVLELKQGHFRYWFESDLKSANEPVYPLTGEYSISGGTITLKQAQVFQPHWTFRTLDGVVSLWRPDAMSDFKFGKYLGMIKKYGGGSILVKTAKPADEVWKQRGPPTSAE